MSRLRKGYTSKLRALLVGIKARRLETGLAWWLERAGRLEAQGLPAAQALAQVCEELRVRLAGAATERRRRAEPDNEGVSDTPSTGPDGSPPRFWCDAGLGGLARWLRAAGYEADWMPGLPDDQVLEEARRRHAVLLTTDSGLLERKVVRDGLIPTLWLAPALRAPEQLAVVRRELALPVRPSRCMKCGGPLRRVAKETEQARIPPRTYRWLEDYFACARCGQLFWHGTHWQRIRARLEAGV